ncbi:hypothetical protein E1218_14055 [Kribbella turkmenica]|uniref:Uncharacterized protein n=1 Tax=Kribbella turkmenica TaxID=2530375 RepID=A0A4R4X6J1_9ACTN|nr:hypothetical protein [Kribbella turkmenica]TDD25889.1 hypothetical protein E1218_14055 [Kribbella turkmenica]
MPPEQTTEPFVVKRRGLGTTKTMLYLGTLVFGLMVLLTLVAVLVAVVEDEPVREPLEAVWLSWGGMPLIFAVGLPVLLLVGLVTTAEERHEGGRDDVLLSIDEAGVYLGGEQPRTVPWSEVRGICRVERREVDTEGAEAWHPYLVVLLYDDEALPRNSKAWGPSKQWPGTVEILGKPLPYDTLVTAVARHAPHVQVTNRGRVPD